MSEEEFARGSQIAAVKCTHKLQRVEITCGRFSAMPPNMKEILWTPSAQRIKESRLHEFFNFVQQNFAVILSDTTAAYEWSLRDNNAFWESVWKFCEIRSSPHTAVQIAGENIWQSGWFVDARFNFAENLLRHSYESSALIFYGEDKTYRALSAVELRTLVAQYAIFFRAQGVKPGDRIAAVTPNIPEAVAALLASASLGAIFSSCSPDFGVQGVLDRFEQIAPTVLFASDGYFFKGAWIDTTSKLRELAAQLPSLKAILLAPYGATVHPLTSNLDQSCALKITVTKDLPPADPEHLTFAPLPFEHPLYILFSSGTTGKPKCIVHSAGGALLEQVKELVLHCDLKRGEKLFFQTTCGWMMWNWMVSGLAVGATLVLYDGTPLLNNGNQIFKILAAEKVCIWGTSAKFISLINKEELKPVATHDLGSLKTILSTGSPLPPESFDYIYQKVKRDVCLSSISGGTDIVGCFALGAADLPVRRGELQTRSLGLAVEVVDDTGVAQVGKRGELVCRNSFPSMPLYFWNDPNGSAYSKAYFERFPRAWHHGDFVELMPSGGMVFYGRSDAVLNPGGVRIGTAEIYREVESIPDVLESAVVAQVWQGDERIVLLVVLKKPAQLTAELRTTITTRIRRNLSPFHVPKKIVAVDELPKTRSGKLVELAIRDVLSGVPVRNTEGLANPETLEKIKLIPELFIP